MPYIRNVYGCTGFPDAAEQSGAYLRFRVPALHVMESFLVPSYFAETKGK